VTDLLVIAEKSQAKTRLIKLSRIKPILQMGFLLLLKNPEPENLYSK